MCLFQGKFYPDICSRMGLLGHTVGDFLKQDQSFVACGIAPGYEPQNDGFLILLGPTFPNSTV